MVKASKNLPEKRVRLSETKEKKSESSPDKETKNARKKRERKELAKKESANKRKNETLSDSQELPTAKEQESDSSVISKHDAFIKSISQSFNSYSLEKASAQ